jgi:WD40 repeat protein
MVRLPDAIDEQKKWEERLRDRPSSDNGPIFMGMVALAGNHKTAASVNLDGTIAVWDVSTRKVQHTLTGHRMPESVGGGIDSLDFSPGGKRVAAGTSDGRVEPWELP